MNNESLHGGCGRAEKVRRGERVLVERVCSSQKQSKLISRPTKLKLSNEAWLRNKNKSRSDSQYTELFSPTDATGSFWVFLKVVRAIFGFKLLFLAVETHMSRRNGFACTLHDPVCPKHMQTHETQEQYVENVISWESRIQSRRFQGTAETRPRKKESGILVKPLKLQQPSSQRKNAPFSLGGVPKFQHGDQTSPRRFPSRGCLQSTNATSFTCFQGKMKRGYFAF